jgi:hypothetical protein
MREFVNQPPAPERTPGLFMALIVLVWGIWLFDISGILYLFTESSQPAGFLMGAMTMLGLRAWFQVELGRRRKWARYALTVPSALGVVVLFANDLEGVHGFGAMIMALVTIYLLHAEPVRGWCTE